MTICPGDKVQISEAHLSELLCHRLLNRTDLGVFTVLRVVLKDVLELKDETGCRRLMHRDSLVLVLEAQLV